MRPAASNRSTLLRSARLAAVLLATLTTLAPHAVRAQSTTRSGTDLVPVSGSLVRVTLQQPNARGHRPRVQARVLTAGPDSLRLAWLSGDTTTLALHDMSRLELGTGPHRPILSSIGMGTVAGGFGLGFLAALSYDDGSCTFLCFSRGEVAGIAGMIGAIGGAAVGGIVGLSRTTERWRTVHRAVEQTRVAVTPVLGQSRGVQVRVAF